MHGATLSMAISIMDIGETRSYTYHEKTFMVPLEVIVTMKSQFMVPLEAKLTITRKFMVPLEVTLTMIRKFMVPP